jgi:hypothetical protein
MLLQDAHLVLLTKSALHNKTLQRAVRHLPPLLNIQQTTADFG